jgi:hypothetical protein
MAPTPRWAWGCRCRKLRPRLLAKKKARPQQGNGTDLEEPLDWEWVPAASLKERMPMPVERLPFSAGAVAIYLGEMRSSRLVTTTMGLALIR